MRDEEFKQKVKEDALSRVLKKFAAESEKGTMASFLEGIRRENADDTTSRIEIIDEVMLNKWKRGETYPTKDNIGILEKEIPKFKVKFDKEFELLCSSEEYRRLLDKQSIKQYKETYDSTPFEDFKEEELYKYLKNMKPVHYDMLAIQQKEAVSLSKINIKIIQENKKDYDFQKKLNEYLKSE